MTEIEPPSAASPGRMVQIAIPVLGAVLWMLCIQRVVVPSEWLDRVAIGLLALYLALTFPQVSRMTRRIVGFCVVATALCIATGSNPAAIPEGLSMAMVFMGFFPAITLIRWAMERSGTLEDLEASFRNLSDTARNDSLMVVGHVVGAIVTMGAFSILVPPSDQFANSQMRTDAAIAALRGVSLAVLWTPFTVGMAFASQHFPEVPLWQVILCGMAIAAIATLTSMSQAGFSELRAIGKSLRSVAVPVLGASVFLSVVNLLTPMTAMDTIVLTTPGIVLAYALVFHRPMIGTIRQPLTRNLGTLGNEMVLFSFSIAMGMALSVNPVLLQVLGHLDLASLPATATFMLLFVVSIGCALAGMHSSVIGAVMIALTAGLGDQVSAFTCFMVVLFGWFCGAMLSMSSLSVAIVNRTFVVPVRTLVLGTNLRFALWLGGALALLFGILNGLGIA